MNREENTKLNVVYKFYKHVPFPVVLRVLVNLFINKIVVFESKILWENFPLICTQIVFNVCERMEIFQFITSINIYVNGNFLYDARRAKYVGR